MKQKTLQFERRCPLLTKKEKENFSKSSEKNVSKYSLGAKKAKLKKLKDDLKKDDGLKNKKSVLAVGDYEFMECPGRLMVEDAGLNRLVDMINWSENMKTPLLGGGLLSHTLYYYKCHQTVVGEQNLIETEERRESESKQKIKRKAPNVKRR